MAKVKNVCVTSEKGPQSGQKNRSSGDFSTKDLDGKRIRWSCPRNVSFHVWRDVSVWGDEKMFHDQTLYDGTITEMIYENGLYIANPKGADGSFDVVASGIFDESVVTSEARPISSQQNRSSGNFSTSHLSGTRIKWSCLEGISFEVWYDRSATGDDPQFHGQRIRNGTITEMLQTGGLYIANPQGASSSFDVRFEGTSANIVTSQPHAISNQDSRSSDNFSTAKLDGTKIKWGCENGNASFRVKRDVSNGGKDEYMFHGQRIRQGTITEMAQENGLYIADPQGTDEQFNVTFEGISSNNIVTSEPHQIEDQDNRSSDNFSTAKLSGTRIKWSCEDENVSFQVWYDRSGAADDPQFYGQRISNGTITEMVKTNGLYIANPKGTKEQFNVTFQGINSYSITSESGHIEDQDHRSSGNFTLDMDYARVECGKDISFKMKVDVSGGDDIDIVKYEKLSNGLIVDLRQCKNRGIYISDPEGADGPFDIDFVSVTINEVDDTANWMGSISNQNLKLSQLSIPGTHDSATKYVGTLTRLGGVLCQDTDIPRQLNDGIRFLDIRLNNSWAIESLFDPSSFGDFPYPHETAMGHNEPLILSHGSISCGITFSQALEVCIDFLKAHPTEVILMSVKSEGKSDDISSDFEKYLECYRDIFYFTETVPTLAEAKGKIVLFYRFEYTPIDKVKFGGTGIRLEINNNTYTYYKNRQNLYLYVEDHYQQFDTHNKVENIRYLLDRATASTVPSSSERTDAGSTDEDESEKTDGESTDKQPTSNDDISYLTFCNIAIGGHYPIQYAWGDAFNTVDPIVNVWLKEYLVRGYDDRRLGIVIMDFYNNSGYDNDPCKFIIGQQKL